MQHFWRFTTTENILIKDAIESVRQYQKTKYNIPVLPNNKTFLDAAGGLNLIPGLWEFIYDSEKIIKLEKVNE